jgi:hypothetical protein
MGQRQSHQSRRKRLGDSHKRQGYLKLPIPSDDADDGAAKSAYRRRRYTGRAAYLMNAGVWDSKQRLICQLISYGLGTRTHMMTRRNRDSACVCAKPALTRWRPYTMMVMMIKSVKMIKLSWAVSTHPGRLTEAGQLTQVYTSLLIVYVHQLAPSRD